MLSKPTAGAGERDNRETTSDEELDRVMSVLELEQQTNEKNEGGDEVIPQRPEINGKVMGRGMNTSLKMKLSRTVPRLEACASHEDVLYH